jgi:DNA-binding response OmpR family regulator
LRAEASLAEVVGVKCSPHEKRPKMPRHVGERRILVVEDEKVVADTLGQILAAHRYDVRIAYSAEDAVSIISTWEPSVAILDVMLPKMNGIELAVILKENLPACHTLLFSGQPSVEGLMQKAKNEGHDFEILAKPVHPSVMLTAISTLLCPETAAHCSDA